MVKSLRVLFTLIFIFMIGVTTWASFDKDVMTGFSDVMALPWGAATMADALCGFLTFYAWVFYKETSWISRFLWLVFIIVGGNITMSFYMMKILYKLPVDARAEDILLRRAA